MKRLFLLLAWLILAGPALAQTVTPQQAQNLLNDVQNPTKRAALIADLKTLAAIRAAPVKKQVTPVRVGTSVLQSAATGLGGISDQILASLATMRELPGVVTWAYRSLADDWSRSRAIETAVKLAGVFGTALIAGLLTWLWTKRLVHRLALMAPIDPNGSATPRPVPLDAPPATTDGTIEDVADTSQYRRLWYLLRLLPILLLRLILDLVPAAMVLGVGYALLGTGLGKPPAVRLVGIAILGVLALERTVWSVAQVLVSPSEPRLRLLTMSDGNARSLVSWTVWVSLAAFLSFAVSSVAGALGMPDGPLSALQKFLTLVAHLLLAAAVLRARKPVARWLRCPPGSTSATAAFRNWLAAVWAWIAIIFILALWFVWAIALQEGPVRLLQIGGITLAVLIGARLVTILALGSLERLVHISPEVGRRLPGIDRRLRQYAMVMRIIFRIILYAVCVLLLFHFWGWDRGHWFGLGHWGHKVLAGAFTVLAALVCGAAAWELANFWLNRQIDHLTAIGALDRSTRLRTLQPMLRTVLLVALLVVLGMTILSEIGVNIGPLLAGAGIVGLAIGFGSQKLVQDVITGLFLLLDNALEVGDWVTAAGLAGSVEHLSLCYLRLRSNDGTLHFIPYSSVTTVSNSNRGGQALATLRFDFAAGTDVDKANNLLLRIGRELRADKQFAPLLLGDLMLQGIEDISGQRVSISALFPCVPSSSGTVIYEFRRRLSIELPEAGIKLANPAPIVQVIAPPPVIEREEPATAEHEGAPHAAAPA